MFVYVHVDPLSESTIFFFLYRFQPISLMESDGGVTRVSMVGARAGFWSYNETCFFWSSIIRKKKLKNEVIIKTLTILFLY